MQPVCMQVVRGGVSHLSLSLVFHTRNVFGLRLNKMTRVVTWATRFPSDALVLGQHYVQPVCMQVV